METMTMDKETLDQLAELPAIGHTDGVKGDLPAVYLWLLNTNATWIVWEYDPDNRIGFGLCDLGLGFPELGYVDMNEIASVAESQGLPVQRDPGLTTRFAGYKNLSLEVPSFLVE